MNILKSAEPIFKLAKDCSNWLSTPLQDAYKYHNGEKIMESAIKGEGAEAITSLNRPGIIDSLKEAHKTEGSYDAAKIAKTAGISYAGVKTAGVLFGGSHSNDDNMLQ